MDIRKSEFRVAGATHDATSAEKRKSRHFHFGKEEGRSHRSKQKKGCTFYKNIGPK